MTLSEYDRQLVNNDLYDELGDRWYGAWDDPVALLRQESQAKLKWATPLLKGKMRILDVGCGAGFVANQLSQLGHEVHGLDQSEQSLRIAQAHDQTQKVVYVRGDAYKLPFEENTFDSVVAFDFLEHVSQPEKIIKEVSRVLRPHGIFLFHTFNRNWLSWLIVLKGVEWFVKNTPPDLHKYSMFLKPNEVEQDCFKNGLSVFEWTGLRPQFSRALFKLIITREVSPEFQFRPTRSTSLSYCGAAIKTNQ